MTTESIIDGIHKFREEYAQRFNNNLKEICDYARSQQGQNGREVIPAHPKPAQNINSTLRKSA